MSQQEPMQTKKYPIQQSAAFASGTFLASLPFEIFGHFGPTGLLVGGLASYVAFKHGPEIYEQISAQVREMFPSQPASEEKGHPKEAREEEQAEEAPQDTLHLGPAFYPHADTVFSNRLVILGMPGAGKSNTVAVIAEELGQYNAPLVMFDQKPEYDFLCAAPYFTNACRANASTLTPETAFDFGQRIMNERLHVVLNLPSYKNDDRAARVMIEIIKGIWTWEERRSNQDRIPCTFFLEEADYWLPQSEHHAHVNRTKDKSGRSLFTELQQAFFDLVHRGRSFGLGIVVCTQRPANVDNRAIAVAEWKLLLKANMPNDLKVYAGFGIDADMAMALSCGEAYVIGPNLKGTYLIRKRYSPDEAQTPGLSNLKRRSSSTSQANGVPTSPTSATEEVSTSASTSDMRSQLRVLNGSEARNEEARSGGEVDEVGEVGKVALTEREAEIAALFFEEGLGINVILKKLYPGVVGGEKYQRANAEITDALRKYVQVQKGA